MSCRHNLLSKPTDTLMASRMSDGAPTNRPDKSLLLDLESVILVFITSCYQWWVARFGTSERRNHFGRRQISAVSLVPYTFVLLGAILTIPAGAFERQKLFDLQDGSLRKLVIHASPKSFTVPPMLTESGEEEELSAHFGPVLVVNFWATWCAPCRKEMPSLNRLQAEFSVNDVKVLAIAVGRHEQVKIASFLESVDAEDLTIRLDPKLKLSAALQVRGLPVTLVLDRQGNEVARLIGDAEWDSESAVQILGEIAKDP